MSFDNQPPPVATGMNTLPPQKSGGGLKWILGGCGCLGLISLICIGGFGYFSYSTFAGVQQEARSFVEGSTAVQEKLGSPVTVNGETFAQKVEGGNQTWVFTFDLSGPDGSGEATVNMKNDGQSLDFKIGKSSLEVNGETFDLDAENEFNLEVEGMDDF